MTITTYPELRRENLASNEEIAKGAREMAKLLKMPVSGQDLHTLFQASLEILERHLDSL